MLYTIAVILFLAFSLFQLCIGFLCYTALVPVWRELSKPAQVFLSPLALYYPVDVFVRVVIFTPIFQIAPSKETITVTELCNSLIYDDTYRGHWARSICRTLNLIQRAHCFSFKG